MASNLPAKAKNNKPMQSTSTALAIPEKYAHLQALRDATDEAEAIFKYVMKQDVDYGKIPGTPKPTLYKAGAEILRRYFRYEPEFEDTDLGSDYVAGIIRWKSTCRLFQTNQQTGIRDYVGMYSASCSSLEVKYKYRWAWKNELPAHYAAMTTEELAELWKKDHGDSSFKFFGKYPKFRIDNDQPEDQAHTVFSIAQKRAFVAAIALVTGVDRIFLSEHEVETGEVNADELDEVKPPEDVEEPKPKAAKPQKVSAESKQQGDDNKFREEIRGLMVQSGITQAEYNVMLEMYPGAKSCVDLSPIQRTDLRNRLLDLVAKKTS